MKTFLILFLAVTCILLDSAYFFTTNNMMMFELLVSAIPSFALSIQPNTNRVKGKFIPYVLSRALPGSITMAIGILALYIVHKTGISQSMGLITADGADTLEYNALMMLALTFTGLVMLFRICQPFNVLRSIIFIGSMSLCCLVISVPFLGNIVFSGWSELSFTLPQILMIIIIVQAAIPISDVLIRLFDMMNPADS